MSNITNKSRLIWIIGSPRSGTTMLADFIGKHVDKMFNEPWGSHPIETPRLWKLPNDSETTIVFKYCENWRNLHVLMHHYPNSVWVHCWRNPDDVVYSMAYPKENSYPPRSLYKGYEGEEKLRLCMQRWYSNMMHSLSVHNVLPRQYTEIRYENMKPGLKKLGEMSNIDFRLKDLPFETRNINPELDWDLNPTARRLRKLAVNCDGPSLVEFINKKRPKMLQRVVL
jgi:hypothetical protein